MKQMGFFKNRLYKSSSFLAEKATTDSASQHFLLHNGLRWSELMIQLKVLKNNSNQKSNTNFDKYYCGPNLDHKSTVFLKT